MGQRQETRSNTKRLLPTWPPSPTPRELPQRGRRARALFATYGAVSENDGSCLGRVGAVGDDLEGGAPEVEADPHVVAAVAQGMSAIAQEVALEEVEAGSASSSSIGPGASGAQATEPPSEASPATPWLIVSDPSASGYMYHEGRSVGRVQYGNPKNSVTINCYQHPSCRLLIAESRCPELLTIKKWLFDVEPPQADATTEEKREMAKRHMASGRAAWFAGRGK